MIEGKRRHARCQSAMAQPGTSLGAVSFELSDRNANRHASAAAVAVWSVGENAAAPEPHFDQFAINISVDQMRWRSDLRARLPMFEIAARIRRRRVKLQRREGQLLEVGHVSEAK